ncbi:anaerobic magnesium-protoporphyrin IX monomethyl ester cyclase [Methylocapsa palsarum]|uniref:Anaerobic magnesium-protoporphyrin IX monomethyl ester cyclase n=1 Tax=Methylocapsa palsarum TaxID=1612308 RepID=A0A1I4CPV8_9HYPH|nr:anaerobic magnesium-protoporphyrin IX monomethyl ester cyclase [Methylocapsa palsarum]
METVGAHLPPSPELPFRWRGDRGKLAPAWAAYLTGSLKQAGYSDVRFIDAMTNDLSDEQLAALIAAERPDIVGATSITPSIYNAERALLQSRSTCESRLK